MPAKPLRHVPAARYDPQVFGAGVRDGRLDQLGRDTPAPSRGWDVGAVELDQTGAGGSICEHRGATIDGEGKAAGDEIVLDGHDRTVARSRTEGHPTSNPSGLA